MSTRHYLRWALVAIAIALASGWAGAAWKTRSLHRQISDGQQSLGAATSSSMQLEHAYADLEKSVEQANAEARLDSIPVEVRRRDAALEVIARLKAQHLLSPPASVPPPPPVGKRGLIFPELLGDPEYDRACYLFERSLIRARESAKLRALGLAADVVEKVIGLKTESQMVMDEIRQLTGTKGPAMPGGVASVYEQQRSEINDQIRAAMGDEAYAKYTAKGEFTYDQGEYCIRSLVTRLSYSDTPLSDRLATQLKTTLDALPDERRHKSPSLFYSDEFTARVKSVLIGEQLEALHQLQIENDAVQNRQKLPKSSELPRLSTK